MDNVSHVAHVEVFPSADTLRHVCRGYLAGGRAQGDVAMAIPLVAQRLDLFSVAIVHALRDRSAAQKNTSSNTDARRLGSQPEGAQFHPHVPMSTA